MPGIGRELGAEGGVEAAAHLGEGGVGEGEAEVAGRGSRGSRRASGRGSGRGPRPGSRARPASARVSSSRRSAIGSLSTSTPSQSKMTRRAGRSHAAVEVAAERRGGAVGPEARRASAAKASRKAGASAVRAVDVAHARARPRVLAGGAGLGLQAVPVRVVRLDRRAAVGGAVAVAAPERAREREAVDRQAAVEAVGDRGDDELRLAVRAVEAEPADGVADLGVVAAPDDQREVVVEVGAGDRRQDRAGSPRSRPSAGRRGPAGRPCPRGRSGCPSGRRGRR